jgi:hypothetical protein
VDGRFVAADGFVGVAQAAPGGAEGVEGFGAIRPQLEGALQLSYRALGFPFVKSQDLPGPHSKLAMADLHSCTGDPLCGDCCQLAGDLDTDFHLSRAPATDLDRHSIVGQQTPEEIRDFSLDTKCALERTADVGPREKVRVSNGATAGRVCKKGKFAKQIARFADLDFDVSS